MASDTGSADQFQSFLQELSNSSNGGFPFFFFPLVLGFNPTQETQDQSSSRDRLIMINPITQSMVVMESSGGSQGMESFFRDLISRKSGPRSASKAAIDALPSVEIARGEHGDDHCVVCLEEWEAGGTAKEMPCKHRFHANCIEKWLKINGTCPTCRYEMPVEEDEDANRKTLEENDGERREIWVRFNFVTDQRDSQNTSTDSSSNHQETED